MDDMENDSMENDSYEEDEVYESTRKISFRDDIERSGHSRGSGQGYGNGPRRGRSAQNNVAMFYVIILVVAIVLCMIIFAIIFSIVSKPTASSPPTPTSMPGGAASEAPMPMPDSSCTGVIQAMDPAVGYVEVLDVAENNSFRLVLRDATSLTDKAGGALVPAEFHVGEIVDVKFKAATSEAHTISKSSNAWILRERDDLSIDQTLKTITSHNDTYSYNANVVAMRGGERISVSQIKPMDVITITGVGNLVWSFELVKGHGTLQITNAHIIQNGTMEIDSATTVNLSEGAPLSLLEGAYHLVIKGDNIEPVSSDVVIQMGKTEHLNLEGLAKVKSSLVIIKVNVSGYRLFVDNEEKKDNIEQPMSLSYGEHAVRVEKEGYVTEDRAISVNEPIVSENITLNPLLRLGKIVVESEPVAAKVYVDSAYIGDTPCSVNIELGQHTLLIMKDGYMTISFPITVDLETEKHPYSVELQPQQEQITVNPYPPEYQTEYPAYPRYPFYTEPPADWPVFNDLPADRNGQYDE